MSHENSSISNSEPSDSGIFVPPLAHVGTGERSIPDIEKPCETILLVEDDDQVREIISQVLRLRGYLVFTADSAEQGIKIFDRCSSINLLVTDVTMPGMNGCELAQHLAQREPGLKAIFISGYDTPVIRDEMLRHNFAFLQKPFTLQELATKVRELIDDTSYPSESTRIN